MQVRATREGDVRVGGQVKALFTGQIYDLPADVVEANDWLRPVEAKAPGGPSYDKAVDGPTRSKRGGNR